MAVVLSGLGGGSVWGMGGGSDSGGGGSGDMCGDAVHSAFPRRQLRRCAVFSWLFSVDG